MTEQAVIGELSQAVIEELSSDDRDMRVMVLLIAIILVVIGVAGATARRARTQPNLEAAEQA